MFRERERESVGVFDNMARGFLSEEILQEPKFRRKKTEWDLKYPETFWRLILLLLLTVDGKK